VRPFSRRLFPGDIIQYYHSISVAGTPHALRQSTITKIEKGDYPLTLYLGDTITLNMQVKKIIPGDLRLAVGDGSENKSNESDDETVDSLLPVFMYLHLYELNYGGCGQHSDAVRRLGDEFSASIKAKRELCVRNAKNDGCGMFVDSLYGAGNQGRHCGLVICLFILHVSQHRIQHGFCNKILFE
jgi:hypothetical protein